MFFGDLSTFDEVTYLKRSRQIDQLSRGDFSPIIDELAAAYPNTDLPVRAIPFIERYVDELSGHYAHPATRTFAGVPEATQARLAALYLASDVDDAMGKAEDSLWTQNVAIIVPMPDSVGRVRLQTLLPWQISSIEVSDPMKADDPRYWTKLVAQVPVSTTLNQVVLGRMELTPTHAYRQVAGQTIGIYSDDTTHDFGRIPVAVVYRVAPDAGRTMPPLNEAVLNLQVALSLQEADNEHIVRNCAFPQKWIRNATIAQLVQTLVHGPDKFMALVRSGDPNAPAPELAVAQGQVPVAELVSFAEHQIRLYCSMLGLDPSTFLRVNTAVTASARLYGAQGRAKIRAKIIKPLAKLEAALLEIILWLVGLREPAITPSPKTLTVDYHCPQPAADRQSEAQSTTAEIAVGVSGAADAVMTREGCSRDEALKIVERNLAESRAQGLVPQATKPDTDPEGTKAAEGAQPAPDTSVAETAMDGAQVTSLVQIIGQAAQGQLPAEAAVQVILAAFPTIAEAAVKAMVQAASTFKPAEPPAAEGATP
jgi:hypothetical protein